MNLWRATVVTALALTVAHLTACASQPERAKIDDDLIRLGFDLAIKQHAPFPEQRAICFSYRTQKEAERDPPADVITELGKQLGKPAFTGSSCGFDVRPVVRASSDPAILYRLEFSTDKDGNADLLMASAVFGNLGAEGVQYRLRRLDGKWHAEPTGMTVIS